MEDPMAMSSPVSAKRSATRLGAAAQYKATCIAQGKGSCSLAISRTNEHRNTSNQQYNTYNTEH